LFAASRDNRIKALVSLDGSERYFPGLVGESKTIHPDQMTIPLIYFEEATNRWKIRIALIIASR